MRKIGKFQVTQTLLKKVTEGDDPILLSGFKSMMNKIIVLRTEESYIADTVTYIAHSEDFREVSEGEVIPTYKAIHDIDNNTFEFKEVTS